MLAAVSVNLVGSLPLFLTGAMAVQIARSMQVKPTIVAATASLFAIASMLSSAPLGRLVGTFGVRRSLQTATIAGAISLVAAAFSPNLLELGGALLIAGVANGLGQPAGNALVAGRVSPERFGIGFGIKQSAIPLATTLGGLAVPTIALTLGWRFAYGFAAMSAVVAFLLIPHDPPAAQQRPEQSVPRSSVIPLWLLASGLLAAVIAATSIGALGTAGGVHIGLPEATAGYLVAIGGLAGLAVRLLSGLLADRHPYNAFLGICALCLAGAVGWIFMAMDSTVWFAIGLIVANAFGWGWPGLQHLSMARCFPTATASASGIAQTGIAAGLLVGPAGLAWVTETAGWTWTWIVAASCSTLGAAIVFIASRLLPDPDHKQTVISTALAPKAA